MKWIEELEYEILSLLNALDEMSYNAFHFVHQILMARVYIIIETFSSLLSLHLLIVKI